MSNGEVMMCIEEAFFERYFSVDETEMKNLESAWKVYFTSIFECSLIAEKIYDGEVVDEPSVVLALQNLILGCKYVNRFKNDLGCHEPITDVYKIIVNEEKDLLAEGQQLIDSGRINKNFRDMEIGHYLVCKAAAINS